jgi:cytochrome P450
MSGGVPGTEPPNHVTEMRRVRHGGTPSAVVTTQHAERWSLMDTQSPLLTIRDPAIIADPYPYYACLRERAPVIRDPNGVWFVSRYADVYDVLMREAASSQRLQRARQIRPDADDPVIRELFAQLAQQMLFVDPPQHTRLRALVSKAFTPTFVQRMRPTIEHIVGLLLEEPFAVGELDVIRELAVPLPMRVICDMLDIPEGDRASLKFWSSEYADFLGSAPVLPHERMLSIARSLGEYMRYFRELSAVRAENPGDDLLTALLQAETDGGMLDREAVCATAVLLITAGHETTTNLIGNGLLALLRQPKALDQLRAEKALWPSAIEELVRFDSPVQCIVRRAAADMSLGAHRIQTDEVLYLMTGSANRDPLRFLEPDRLIFARAKNRHLSFGQGPHYCIGAALARLEAQVALSALLERTQGMQPIDARPQWVQNPGLRGLATFRLKLDVAKAA